MDDEKNATRMKTETPEETAPPETAPPEAPPENAPAPPAAAQAPVETPSVNPFAAIGAALVQNKPEKQEHFVREMAAKLDEEAQQTAVSETKDWRHLKDKKGRFWTPGVCSAAVDRVTGQPEKTKTGCWVILKGRTSAECAKRPPKKDDPSDVGAVNDAQAAAEMRSKKDEISAAMIFGLYYQGAHIAFPKAAPEVLTAQNCVLHQHALKSWFATFENGADIPPWLQAAAVFGSSAVAIAMHKESEQKRSKIKETVQFLWWKITRRTGKPSQPTKEAQPIRPMGAA